MSSFMYFLGAIVIVIGVLYLGGYIGTQQHMQQVSRQVPISVDGVIGTTAKHRGDCVSCKWY